MSKIPNESKTHRLEVNVKGCYGWLISKDHKPYKKKLSYMRNLPHLDVYLSTHTFYGNKYENSTKLLKACGFDVEIDNWDKKK